MFKGHWVGFGEVFQIIRSDLTLTMPAEIDMTLNTASRSTT